VKLSINGQDRDFPAFESKPLITHLVDLLEMKADRIAIERNGDIVPRSTWASTPLQSGDKIEIVQFVGGGC
jgi:sulfur carrier protein